MVVQRRDKLSGRVEVDESWMDVKKSGKKGNTEEKKSLVMIAVELMGNGLGRVRLSLVSDASDKSLEKFITANIELGSRVITNGWKGYSGLSGIGYRHEVQKTAVLPDGVETMPNVHRIASSVKRWLSKTHQNNIGEQYLSYYLDEYLFRYHNRKSKSRGLLFQRLIEQGVSHVPVDYKQIRSMRHVHMPTN